MCKSRTITGGVLGLALVVAAGCGSKPAPPEPNQPINPDSGSNPDAAAKPVYELDPARHAIPAHPVSGTIGGAEVTPEAAIEGEFLVFRTPQAGTTLPERELSLKLRASSGQMIPVGKRTVRQEMPEGPDVPEVRLAVPGKQTRLYPNGYALTLELEPRKAGKVAGKIYLCLPDDEKTLLAGTFVAAAPRQPNEPPGVEDVPLVNGSVTVVGTAPGAVLTVGYAANPQPDLYPLGAAQIPLGDEVTAQATYDKPRVTSLTAGDGKTVPSRYEHSKLTPGRYLVFAALKNGPAAWKWVDVGPQSTVAVDLTIDATRTGGLEVNVPLGALGKVQLAPADDPHRPPMDANMFIGVVWQLNLEQDIVLRKALFKNLGPGRYEVRAGKEIRVVEIVAGKTMELDFDAKPLPGKPDPAPEPRTKG